MVTHPIADLAIVGGQLLTLARPEFEPVRGTLLVRDGIIVAVNQDRRPPARQIIDARGKVVMPGFVDAHAHSIHLLMRGMSDGLRYHEWLQRLMYRALPHYEAEDALIASQLFCAEAIRSGITTVADSTDFGNRADLVSATLKGLRRAGVRHVYFRNFSNAPPRELAGNKEKASAALQAIDALIGAYRKRRGLTTVGPGINEPHFVTPAAFRAATNLATRHGVPMMAHIAEVPADVTIDGINVVDWLIKHRSLSPRLVLAHCVWLDAKHFRKLARAGASVTWQPSTNAFLADGVMPLRAALDAGVAVGLGTDDTNANDRVNMFFEMRTAALVTKLARMSSAAVSAEELVWLATRGGARALGMENYVGSLEVGKAADIVLIDLDALRPITRLASALVYQANGEEVETVIVAGKVLMREGELQNLDEGKLRRRAQRSTDRLMQRAGLRAAYRDDERSGLGE